jgi:hypothetical protein
MAVSFVGSGAVTTSVNGATGVNVPSPATLAGDVRIMFCTCNVPGMAMNVLWSQMLVDESQTGMRAYAYWKIDTVDTAAANVRLDHQAGISRGIVVALRGANTTKPDAAHATIKSDVTALTTIDSFPTAFEDFALMCTLAAPSPTISGQVSVAGRWTATERADAVTAGAPSVALTTGPMSAPGTDTLRGVLNAARNYVVMAVGPSPLAAATLPFRVGVNQVAGLRVGVNTPSAAYLGTTKIL